MTDRTDVEPAPRLDDLLNEHGSDKARPKNDTSDGAIRRPLEDLLGAQDSGWHGYSRYYVRLFAPYRSSTSLRLLEIGVNSGSSMKVWQAYFSR